MNSRAMALQLIIIKWLWINPELSFLFFVLFYYVLNVLQHSIKIAALLHIYLLLLTNLLPGKKSETLLSEFFRLHLLLEDSI